MKYREITAFEASNDEEIIAQAKITLIKKIAENANNKYNVSVTLTDGSTFTLFWNCGGLNPIFK